jgi:hypothetical protein
MANMASVSYMIEGPKEVLEKINNAIIKAMDDKKHWTEWVACELLDIPIEKGKTRLGGLIEEEPSLGETTLEFYAEERWGLQDFEELLRNKFPDIKVYWIVEECGCEVYCTNDKEGKYFPERYWVDTAQDDIYQSEYFKTEEAMWKWLSEKYGVKSKEEVEAWNQDYEATGDECENFVIIHKFEIVD